MKPWVPMVQGEVDPDYQRKARLFGVAHAAIDEAWANDEYVCVVVYLDRARGRAGGLHLWIKRHDREPANDWRDLQAIKNEIAGWEREGLQLHPAESRLVDQANQTHLWVLGAGAMLEVGWQERVVKSQAEAEAECIAALGHKGSGRQRDWRPNISTGPEYQP